MITFKGLDVTGFDIISMKKSHNMLEVLRNSITSIEKLTAFSPLVTVTTVLAVLLKSQVLLVLFVAMISNND